MILVDTSVWIQHLRTPLPSLVSLLHRNLVLSHPFVQGELALGNLQDSQQLLGYLGRLPQAIRADDSEVLMLIGNFRLAGAGIGYVDAHLLASTLITPGAGLWTQDRRLEQVATRLSVAALLP